MKKPKIEFYWYQSSIEPYDHKVNWRLIGANGEIMCQSTQGFRDKTDAIRSVDAVAQALFSHPLGSARIVGPGRKPK